MTRKVQARTLATRDRLLSAGREIVAAQGMAGLRTEEVVLRAGTAKGTFFAHFQDRGHFLAALLAESLQAHQCRDVLIVVSDNGSTDWTRAVAIESAAKIPYRVVYHRACDHGDKGVAIFSIFANIQIKNSCRFANRYG